MTDMSHFHWVNEPSQWSRHEYSVSVVTDAKTDFWTKTWYGFERFNGHFLGADVWDDFTFQVKISADFQALYDQAGIMFFADDQHWLKAGVEINDGIASMGSVLTLGHSDWATGILPANRNEFWMRITKKANSLRVQYSVDGHHWPLLRLAHFPEFSKYSVGVMCCSPEREGLTVKFDDFSLTSALDKKLHDLS